MASRRTTRKPRPATPSQPLLERPWLLAVVLAIATLAAYQPAWHGGVLWDDDAHLTAPALASGAGLVRIWTDITATQQYYPVVNTAFWLMNRLWGYDTFGYHIVNILLHALSATLVAGILRRLAVPGAAIAAVIFALHPVHVESVAWMTELKNTLSGVFYLLAAAAYLRFDDTRARRPYLVALVLFVLALGSKTVTATLPAALLVVLWWRRGRLDWRQDVVPLLPFLAVGFAAGVTTAYLEYAWVGAQGESFDLTLIERFLLAGRTVWFYAGKLVWPVNLIFSYPRWTIDQAEWWQYAFPIALAAALAAMWAIRGRTRAPLAAALFFCGTLFPAVGFLNVFPFKYSFVADHFQYLASIGLIALAAAGLVLAARRWRPGLPELTLALVVGAPLFGLTFLQSRHYVDEKTLFRAILAANPDSRLARNNLAALLLDGPPEGWAEAEHHGAEAVRLAPNDAEAHSTLGLAWQRQGRYADSIGKFRDAIRLKPELFQAHYNLGISLAATGQPLEAIASYEQSLRILPDQPDLLHNLSKILVQQGRLDDAMRRAREAARLAPESAEIRLNLANTAYARGLLSEAIAACQDAIRLRPEWGEAHHNLGVALRRAERNDEALAAFEGAAQRLPASALVRMSLGSLLAVMGRLDDAVAQYQRALEAPDVQRPAEVHNEIGVLLIRLGRPAEAILQFEAALQLRPDLAAARANLARAKKKK